VRVSQQQEPGLSSRRLYGANKSGFELLGRRSQGRMLWMDGKWNDSGHCIHVNVEGLMRKRVTNTSKERMCGGGKCVSPKNEPILGKRERNTDR